MHAVDPSKAGSSKFVFMVDCNAPFQYSIQSDNGALRFVNPPAGVLRDQIEVAYDAHIRIPLTLGGVIDDTCSSTSIKQGAISCKFTDSGQKIAVNQTAVAQINWQGTQNELLMGQYTDQLVVFVSVKA